MWLRIILIGILIYLIASIIGRYLSGGKKKGKDKDNITGSGNTGRRKGVPDDVGEYIDYEEVDDD
ncbi:MAG: hypothetical protein JW965_09895 [Bacteroidales bacterium]|nr:hypothetical protein [Bacteroidales bacterium]